MLNTKNSGIILSQNTSVPFGTHKNTNTLIVAPAESGKKLRFILPNLLMADRNYVVNDPSGDLFQMLSGYFKERGYHVMRFALNDPTHSHVYNPFDYLKNIHGTYDEAKIDEFVDIILNSMYEQKTIGRGDMFWQQASKALLKACVWMILECYPEPMHNMSQLARLIEKGRIKDGGEETTDLENLFDKMRASSQSYKCLEYFDTFRLSPTKTMNSILISLSVDLYEYHIPDIQDITTTAYNVKTRNLRNEIRMFRKDENGDYIRTEENVDFKNLLKEKTIIFTSGNIKSATHQAMITMFYVHMFNTLCEYQSKATRYTQIILDEAGNWRVDNLSYALNSLTQNTSVSLLVQSISNLKHTYEKDWENITALCPNKVFFGTINNEQDKEYIYALCGESDSTSTDIECLMIDTTINMAKFGEVLVFTDDNHIITDKCFHEKQTELLLTSINKKPDAEKTVEIHTTSKALSAATTENIENKIVRKQEDSKIDISILLQEAFLRGKVAGENDMCSRIAALLQDGRTEDALEFCRNEALRAIKIIAKNE